MGVPLKGDLFEGWTPPKDDPATRTKPRKGHAARPGSGPVDVKCKHCDHVRRHEGSARTFIKCYLTRATWTHGPGSDIKANDPACELFKVKENG